MISSHTNSIPCASTQSSLSEEISLKIEDASPLESRNVVVSKLTRKHTVRKFFRSETGSKVYICYLDSCSRQFNHLSSLIKHERIHRNERPYVCSICGQSFIQSSNLKRHEKSHTGEKPYKCDLCPKQFSTACNLRQHTQIHESCSGELKYSCSKCGKAYIYTSSLIKHQKKCTHSDTQSDSSNVFIKVESDEDVIRKIIKTEEKYHDIEIPSKLTISEDLKSPLSTCSTQNLVSPADKIISDLSNSVRSKHSSLMNDSFPSAVMSQFPASCYSTYPSYDTSLGLLSQALHNAGSAASRLGFGFNNPSPLYSLQSGPSFSLFNMDIPSDPFTQAAIERHLLQENMELRNSIRSSLLRSGRF